MITMGRMGYIKTKRDLIPTMESWNLLSYVAQWPETSNPTIQHNIDEIPYSVYADTDGFFEFWANPKNRRDTKNVWSVVDQENKIAVFFLPDSRKNKSLNPTMVGPFRYSYLSGTKTLSYQHYITNGDLEVDAELFQKELDTTMFLYDNGEKLPKWSFYRFEPDPTTAYVEVMNWREFPDEILY